MPTAAALVVLAAAVLLAAAARGALQLARLVERPLPWRYLVAVLLLGLVRQMVMFSELDTANLVTELLVLMAAALAAVTVRFQAPMAAHFVVGQQAVAHREALVAALADASGALLSCTDVDELCRHAVEFARGRLGVQRCSIWLPGEEPGQARGTFGTNDAGETVDLRSERREQCSVWQSGTALLDGGRKRYAVIENPTCKPHLDDDGGAPWLAVTPIQVEGRLKAVLFNDPGQSGAPVDPLVQEVLVVYTALIGRLLERYEAEAAKRAGEVRLQQIIRLSGGVAYERDWLAQRYTFLGPGIERLTGYQPEALTPRFFEELVVEHGRPEGPDHRRELEPQPGDEAVGASHLYSADYRIVAADGSLRWLHDVAVQFRGPDSKLTRSIGILTDITARKQLEAELQQAQKMEALGRLAGGLAHDLNNLLTTILGYSDLIRQGLEPQHDLQRDLLEVRRAAEAAAELSGGLLAFSQRQVLAPRPLDLNAMLRDLERVLPHVLRPEIALVFDLAEPLPLVAADPAQMQQVVVYLANHARDAMPDGGRLRLSTASRASGVELIVEHNGRELDEASCQSIFEPFSPVWHGTGLSLAAVYGVVTQSGGRIQAQSEPGQGTRFVIWLPPADEALSADMREPAHAPARSGATVLLVEDNPGVKRLVEEVLGSHGYRVVSASDADSAEKLADAGTPFDLLLTDIALPGRSGPSLAAAIREHRPGLPVLYMSGFPADDAGRYEQAVEPHEFLAKPFGAHDLARKVAERLAHRPSDTG